MKGSPEKRKTYKKCINFIRRHETAEFGTFLCHIRDLKHQDWRWRRGRHIRVKAEAGPASRFTRLSMLSNTATAT